MYLYEFIRPTRVLYRQISRYTVNSRLSHTFLHLVVYFRHMGPSFNPLVYTRTHLVFLIIMHYTRTHLVFLIIMHHMLFQIRVKCVVTFVGVMMPYNRVKHTVIKAPGLKYFAHMAIPFGCLYIGDPSKTEF